MLSNRNHTLPKNMPNLIYRKILNSTQLLITYFEWLHAKDFDIISC